MPWVNQTDDTIGGTGVKVGRQHFRWDFPMNKLPIFLRKVKETTSGDLSDLRIRQSPAPIKIVELDILNVYRAGSNHPGYRVEPVTGGRNDWGTFNPDLSRLQLDICADQSHAQFSIIYHLSGAPFFLRDDDTRLEMFV